MNPGPSALNSFTISWIELYLTNRPHIRYEKLLVLAFTAGVVHPEGLYHFFDGLLLRFPSGDKTGDFVTCNDPVTAFVLRYGKFFHVAGTSDIGFYYLKYIKSEMEFKRTKDFYYFLNALDAELSWPIYKIKIKIVS